MENILKKNLLQCISKDAVFMDDGKWKSNSKFYVYVHEAVCVYVFIPQQQQRRQQQRRQCKLRVTDRDQAGTDLINRYLSLM